MLEDRKEWEPQQDLIIDDMIRQIYELWFTCAAMEGRFDDVTGFGFTEFMADQVRYTEAEYIPPPQTWIDPEKEANAFAMLIKNRLITREEIVAMRGHRFYNIIQKIAAEHNSLDNLELRLPEDAEERTDLRNVIKAGLTQALTAYFNNGFCGYYYEKKIKTYRKTKRNIYRIHTGGIPQAKQINIRLSRPVQD